MYDVQDALTRPRAAEAFAWQPPPPPTEPDAAADWRDYDTRLEGTTRERRVREVGLCRAETGRGGEGFVPVEEGDNLLLYPRVAGEGRVPGTGDRPTRI